MTDCSELVTQDSAQPVANDDCSSQWLSTLEIVHHITTLVSPGDLVIEAGLASAEQALMIAVLCDVRVLAFEPDRPRAEVLVGSINSGGMRHRIEVRREALGDGTAASGDQSTVALDDLTLPVPPKLLRINTAGSVLGILHGAERTIQRHHPLIHLQLASTVELGVALVLLSQWGYVPEWQMGTRPILLCSPGPRRSVELSRSVSRTDSPYEELESAGTYLRQIVEHLQSQVPPRDQGRPAEALEPILVEIAQRLDKAHMLLEQQAMQTRRMEAYLVGVKRRLELQPQTHKSATPFVTNTGFARRAQERTSSRAGSLDAIGRKLQKLRREPVRFLRDAKNPVLRFLGRSLSKNG